MAFEAQYSGYCSECLGGIKPGQMIRYNDADQTVHVDCPDILPVAAKVCPSCQMALPATGVCDDCS